MYYLKNKLLFLLVFLFQYGYSQVYPSVNITAYDGLPNNEIMSLYKDSRGIVWAGTQNGVSAILNDEIKNFNKENKHWLNFIEDLYFKILKRKIDKVNFRNDIKELFAYFENEIYDKFYYLTELNKKRIPFILELSMTNLFNYIIILMCSLFFLITNYSLDFKFRITIILVSLFFSNTIDLILIIYVSLNKELEINEILKF